MLTENELLVICTVHSIYTNIQLYCLSLIHDCIFSVALCIIIIPLWPSWKDNNHNNQIELFPKARKKFQFKQGSLSYNFNHLDKVIAFNPPCLQTDRQTDNNHNRPIIRPQNIHLKSITFFFYHLLSLPEFSAYWCPFCHLTSNLGHHQRRRLQQMSPCCQTLPGDETETHHHETINHQYHHCKHQQ